MASQKEIELQKLKALSPYALPDDTAASGWTTAQIKEKFYAGLLYLYELFDSMRTGVDGDLLNQNTEIQAIRGLVNQVIADDSAVKDDEGNTIKTTYAKIANIANGSLPALKYVKSAQESEDINAIEPRIMTIVNQLAGYFTNAKANTALVAEKANADSDGRVIKTTYETKNDATAKVSRANLVSILGEAGESANGLMSASDKTHLNALYALLGASDDVDSVVNTINEVLAIFSAYPEGVTLSNALALKLNVSDVVNSLDSNETAKALSAAKGKALNDRLTTVENSYVANTDVVELEGIASLYSSESTYSKGDLVVYSTKLYQAKQNISTAEAFTAGHWDEITVADVLKTKLTKGDFDGSTGVGYATLAGNLDSKVVQNDTEPYNYRTAGGSLEIGNTCKENAIIGGTVFWNQGVHSNFEQATTINQNASQVVSSNSTDKGFLVKGHKYFVRFHLDSALGDDATNLGNVLFGYQNTSYLFQNVAGNILKNSKSVGWRELLVNVTADITNYRVLCIYNGCGEAITISKFNAFDLTAMLGKTIADFVATLESGTAGAGVAFLKKYFLKKPYYPYCAPTPVNVKVGGKKRVRFNLWDEEVEISGDHLKSKNFIPALPNTAYYFKSPNGLFVTYYDANQESIGTSEWFANSTITTPSGCAFMKFTLINNYGTTYNHDICLNFHYDGERDGEYEPYEEEIEALDPTWEGRGIFRLDASNNLYADGDRYNSDGSVEGNYDEVDLSEIPSWGKSSGITSHNAFFTDLPLAATSAKGILDALCSTYQVVEYNGADSVQNKTIIIGATNFNASPKLLIIDDDYNDATAFGNAVSGHLVYKKAIPTSSSATPFSQIQSVDNWGTEEYLPPESDARPIEVPVTHDTDYPLDCKSKVEIAPDLPSSDGTYVLKVESGAGTYTSLATYLSDNGYEKVVDKSSGITDVAGLTYNFKKAYKTGNIVTLSIRAVNETGNAIQADTTLCTLESGLFNGNYAVIVGGVINNDPAKIEILTNGHIRLVSELPNNGKLHIYATYAVA